MARTPPLSPLCSIDAAASAGGGHKHPTAIHRQRYLECTGDAVALTYLSGINGLTAAVKFRWNGNGVEFR